MNQLQKIIKPKLSLLELAKRWGNVQKACKVMGYSRDSYYRYKKLYEQGGEIALHEISRKKPIKKNRVDKCIEKAVVNMAYEYPTYGQYRVAEELKRRGILVSGSGVRSVWLRHDLECLKKRLIALEAKVTQDGHVLTEYQRLALEKSKKKHAAHGEIKTYYPGYLCAQDTYFVGHIKGIGKVYQQTFIDTYTRLAIVKLYTEKSASCAVDMLKNQVLPKFHEQFAPLLRILTDRGTEFCGKKSTHAYQRYLNLKGIVQFKTNTYRPQINEICERFHKIMKNECYEVILRRKRYQHLDDIQEDVNRWLSFYNNERPHSGKYCYGKTPWQTWLDAKIMKKREQFDHLFAPSITQDHVTTPTA